MAVMYGSYLYICNLSKPPQKLMTNHLRQVSQLIYTEIACTRSTDVIVSSNLNYKLNVSHLDFWQSFTGENRELWNVPKKFSWWTCWFSLFFFPHTLVLRTRFAHPGCAHKHFARFYFYFIFIFIWLFIAHFIEMKDINVWFLIY